MDFDARCSTRSSARSRTEGNYRIFAELERRLRSVPPGEAAMTPMRPTRSPSGARTTISAWARTTTVRQAMKDAIDQCGTGAGGTRNISGTNQ
jgi:5-aminolevulinate synthase